jgi:hypothetical protein
MRPAAADRPALQPIGLTPPRADASVAGSRRLPTTDLTYVIVALCMVAGLSLLLPIQPEDFWWNMALGRETVQLGRLPAVDTFSYTQPGEPIFVHGWLPQVLFYLLYSVGGAVLIAVVQAAVLVGTYGLLLLLCVKRGARPGLAAILLLAVAIPLSVSNWNVRPQSYALVLLVLMLHVLHRWQRQDEPSFSGAFWKGRLWALPVIMLLWVNMHGSFVLGGILIALTFVAESVRRAIRRLRPDLLRSTNIPVCAGRVRWSEVLEGSRSSLTALFVAGALAAAVIPLNPTGLDIIRFTLMCARDPDRRINSVEWRPPVVTDADGPVFFGSVVVVFAVLVLVRRRPTLTDLVQMSAFFWLGLQGVRYIIWFALILTPILAKLLAAPREAEDTGKPPERSPFNLLLVTSACGLVVALLPPLKPLWLPGRNGHLLSPNTPVAAVNALESISPRPSRLFHSSWDGSYLMWAAPEQGIFIDSRLQDFYGPKLVADYCTLTEGERVPELVSEYQFDGLLLSRVHHRRLIETMSNRSDWREVYVDATHVIFVPRIDPE